MDYYSKIRTNYFRVTDKKEMEDIAKYLLGDESDVHVDFSDSEDNTCMIWCESSFGYQKNYIIARDSHEDSDDDMYDENGFDTFLKKIQEVIAPDDAMIVTEVGSEGMRYLVGNITVVTANRIESMNLDEQGRLMAQKMLGNPSWDTQNEY